MNDGFSREALPRIGLGTWQTFDVGSDAAARAQLREVLKLLDGNVVDSSPMYGSSETVAGDLIAELGLRERLFVATKVWTNGRAEGIRQMETSFRRLRVERMDLMQIHNLVDVETHTRTLLEMKSRKKIRFLGITHYTSSAYAEVERWLDTRQYDFLQIKLFACRTRSGKQDSRKGKSVGRRRHHQPPVCRRRAVPQGQRQAATALGGRDRCRELGAVLPEVDRVAPCGDLRDPGHQQARAHAGQPCGGFRRSTGRGSKKADGCVLRFAVKSGFALGLRGYP